MKPPREHASNNGQTYFITPETAERRMLFANERWARLFLEALYRERAFLLHDFVVMPEHFHATITPVSSLEKAAQFIKGGFSSSASGAFELDPVPQRLKPVSLGADNGTAKAVPLQTEISAKASRLESDGMAKAVFLQSKRQEE